VAILRRIDFIEGTWQYGRDVATLRGFGYIEGTWLY
jgi:hypothetical protein